jgi:hypothetical protein
MLTETNVQKVIEEFHELWRHHKTNPSLYLSKKGVPHKVHSSYEGHADFGNIYLLTVPSLNISGGLHHIILDLRDEETDEVVVFDPNRGKHGKYYYQGWDKPLESAWSVVLHAWIIDLIVEYKKEDPCPH